MKVQDHSSLNHHWNTIRTGRLQQITASYDNLGVARILYSFRLILEQKTGKEMPESGRLELFERFSANNSDLSNDEENTSGPLNRGGIADLPLLRKLLAISQKSREPRSWEVIDSFVLLA